MNAPDAIASLGPYRYCTQCAAPLTVTDREEWPRRYCEACDRVYYHNPVPAAGGVIMQAHRVLLVRRKYPPRVGDWTLPAGFMEYLEGPEECARREVREETGLETRICSLFGAYAGKDDPRHRAVLILYRMDVTGGSLQPGDDATEAAWFSRDEQPDNIAFRAHRVALEDLFGPERTH